MRSLREVRDSLLAREKKRIAVAAAEDRPVLEAVKEAVQMGIAEATLCGDEAKIRMFVASKRAVNRQIKTLKHYTREIYQVKEFLGHEKLDTTMIYCTIKEENVHASHRKYA